MFKIIRNDLKGWKPALVERKPRRLGEALKGTAIDTPGCAPPWPRSSSAHDILAWASPRLFYQSLETLRLCPARSNRLRYACQYCSLLTPSLYSSSNE